MFLAAAPVARAQGEAEIPVRADLQPVLAARQMVAAANPLASAAGLEILKAGGSAVDAAIAMQLVLGLVEPQSSGIGGGGFLLAYDKSSRRIRSFDGRETAPAASVSTQFLDRKGRPVAFTDAWAGGRSVGVPGMMRMLELAHRKHGRLPWSQLFDPAIRLAREGFEVTPRLNLMISLAKPYIRRFPTMAALYLDRGGEPQPVGARIVNPAYAKTLALLARNGAGAFYRGRLARDIAAAVRLAPMYPARLTTADLAGYAALEREPVCGAYRGFKLCSMGPPSSGATTVLQTLKLVERFDLGAAGIETERSVHLISQAMALAYADREKYLADPAFGEVPVNGLLAHDYIAQRTALIDEKRWPRTIAAGNPPREDRATPGPSIGPDVPSTSHFVAVDAQGNVASMTGTVQAPFGSFLMAGGFILNNEMTDFAFLPRADRAPVANRIEPGKRPRSSMAPTIVTDAEGRFVMALGSAGGSRIIAHVIKTVIGVLDWGLDVQKAIALPNFGATPGGTDLELGTPLAALKPALEARGHAVSLRANVSGLQAIQAVRDLGGNNTLLGGADPRREGVALGD